MSDFNDDLKKTGLRKNQLYLSWLIAVQLCIIISRYSSRISKSIQ